MTFVVRPKAELKLMKKYNKETVKSKVIEQNDGKYTHENTITLAV